MVMGFGGPIFPHDEVIAVFDGWQIIYVAEEPIELLNEDQRWDLQEEVAELIEEVGKKMTKPDFDYEKWFLEELAKIDSGLEWRNGL